MIAQKRLAAARLLLPSTALWACLVASVPAASRAADGEAAEGVARGRLLFRIYCASCHGETAAGDGPVARHLRVRPPDLTRLSGKEEAFPTERVYRAIDGRESVGPHGRREMPVWGLSFQVEGSDADQEEEVRDRIEKLIAFLRTVQETPPDTETPR